MRHDIRGARGRWAPAQMKADLKLKEEKLAAAEAVAETISVPDVAPKTEFGGNYHTAQIYSQGFEFAFMTLVEGIYKQMCTFVYCKDFLHDAVWAHINKKPWSIWSFSFNPSKTQFLDDNNCVFAFRNTKYKGKEAEFHAMRQNCQDFLNQIEAVLGFQPSKVYEVPHSDGPCWLIVGDKGWQHAAPMVGFFTLFIRVGIAHTAGQPYAETLRLAREGKIVIGTGEHGYAGANDCKYIQQSQKGLDVILKHGLKVFHPTIQENYPPDLPQRGASLHDAYGPVNFTSGSPKKAMPHWYREEIWK